MKKKFNITGCCYPDRHYMVDISAKLEEIKELVDGGEYFIINRARQYGKTTTLKLLKRYLEKDYIVLALDFQNWGMADFQDEERFASSFADSILRLVRNKKNNIQGLNENVLAKLESISKKELPDTGLRVLFQSLNELCDTAPKQVVLMIDEVDNASNNMVFLDFFGKLRSAYLHRDNRATFQSVIFASVYDILLYLKPIINGVGNYYIEAQTRDATRTDIVVDYLGERFVIELKIWRGKVYHEKGEKQLSDYLNAFNLNKGYMLIFSFNKNKQIKVEEVQQSKKTILEVVV